MNIEKSAYIDNKNYLLHIVCAPTIVSSYENIRMDSCIKDRCTKGSRCMKGRCTICMKCRCTKGRCMKDRCTGRPVQSNTVSTSLENTQTRCK